MAMPVEAMGTLDRGVDMLDHRSRIIELFPFRLGLHFLKPGPGHVSLIDGCNILKAVHCHDGPEGWVIRPGQFAVLREDIEEHVVLHR